MESTNVRDAMNYAPVRALSRVGLAAYGGVHLLVAELALQVALSGGNAADKSGALKTLAGCSAGRVLLWMIAGGFASVVLWQLGEAIYKHCHVSSVCRRLWRRAFNIGEAAMFGLFAFSAGSIAAGGSAISDADQRSATATILALPGGQFLVGVIGTGIIAAAVGLVCHGLTKAFLRDMDLSSADPWLTQLVIRLGQIGWTALGVAYGTAGVLVVLAARQSDPRQATGLDRALKALSAEPYGVAELLFVAAGLACFGVYCLFEARYRQS